MLRAGAESELFDETRAPSTIGSWLRAHKWSNVRQHDAISQELLKRLRAAGAGPQDLAGPLTIDLDSTIVPVHGRSKQGAALGYTTTAPGGSRLSPAADDLRPDRAGADVRLRGGAACGACGAKSFLTETVSRARHAGATGQLTVRADSAFYRRAVLHTAVKLDVAFSVTARQDKRIRAAIERIDEDAFTPIPYWLSSPEVSAPTSPRPTSSRSVARMPCQSG